MTRFVRIFPDPSGRGDPGGRIRVDYDPDGTGVFGISDEDTLPEKINDPDCVRVTSHAHIELDRDTVKWLRQVFIELDDHLNEQE